MGISRLDCMGPLDFTAKQSGAILGVTKIIVITEPYG